MSQRFISKLSYLCFMGLSLDTQNCGLRMRWECRERFPRHRLKRKTLVSDPDMHHGTCVTHVPWCMSGSLTPCGGENVPGIPGACTTRKFMYLTRGPWLVALGPCFFQNQIWLNVRERITTFYLFMVTILIQHSINPQMVITLISTKAGPCNGVADLIVRQSHSHVALF